ncbi:MAG: hypothetical protein IJ417_00590 [Bacteroidaceae bacterium]|nr:hypothetical protein [Bacteroidaceae bacterium]
MIVISKHSNQLCNRLFTYLPVLSYALEAGESVCFLFQYKGYDGFFPNLRESGIASYLPDDTLRPSISSKLLNAFVRFMDKLVHVVLKPGERIPLRKPLGLLFNPKWKEIRYDSAYIAKHTEELRRLFTPANAVWQAIAEMMPPVSEEVVTVGVHMRGGDYRTYLGGKYFYEPSVYCRYMRQIKTLLASQGKQVRFLLCTNERVIPSDFSGLELLRQQGSDLLVDLYGLSRCDYIIGPPSTFSQWASFYGGVPLRFLQASDESVSLSDFKKVVALDKFEP